jgi:hypothetical protein
MRNYQIEHDNGTDGQTWVRAHLDYDCLAAQYATKALAEEDASHMREENKGIRFRVIER